MDKNIYVVNAGHSLMLKSVIKGPGQEISQSDLKGENPEERFNRLIEADILILKKDFIPEETPDDNPFYDDKNAVKKITKINLVLNPDSLVIPEDHKSQIDNFVDNMKFPDYYKKERLQSEKNQLKMDSYFNYRRVFDFLSGMNFQRGRLMQQSLSSSLRRLKFIEKEMNEKPETIKIVSNA